MPQTSFDKLSPTRAKLTVRVSPEELKPSIEHAYQHIAEDITIPGFRKGKVPAAIINQRVGKAAVLEHAVNEGLDRFYRDGLGEAGLVPLGRPTADIAQWPSAEDFSGDLVVDIEVDVRPDITLPGYSDLSLSVDAIEVSADEIQNELDALRARFGTLASVDRPAQNGDYLTIDLTATIDGKIVDEASGLSYQLGSGELIDGIDEAVETLTAGESTTFMSTLLGGEHEGKQAHISVTVTAVKERDMPPADDEFAQIASEFDTVAQLRDSLKTQVARRKTALQADQARRELVSTLIAKTDIPVAQAVIDDEVHRHLEGEGRLEDDVHRAEVVEQSIEAYKTQILFDAIAEREGITLADEEISQYLVQSAAQYNMGPQDFVNALNESGQLQAVIAELARNKVIAILLGRATVRDRKGAVIDLSEFTRTADSAQSVPADQTAAPSDATKPKKAAAKKKAKADSEN